jgi:hypothetical protein
LTVKRFYLSHRVWNHLIKCIHGNIPSFNNARNTDSAANAVATILNYLFDQAVSSYVTIHVDPSRNNCYLHSNRCCAECSGTIYVNSLPNTGAAVSYYNAEYSGVTIQHLQYTGASVSTYSAICSDTCLQLQEDVCVGAPRQNWWRQRSRFEPEGFVAFPYTHMVTFCFKSILHISFVALQHL